MKRVFGGRIAPGVYDECIHSVGGLKCVGSLEVLGLFVAGGLKVDKNLKIHENLKVAGGVIINGDLIVGDEARIAGGVKIGGNCIVKKLLVSGGVNIGKSLAVDELLKVAGSIYLGDSLLCKGDASAGGSIHANKILVQGTLISSGGCTAKIIFCGSLLLSGDIKCTELKVARAVKIAGSIDIDNITVGERLEIELGQSKPSRVSNIYVGRDLIIKSKGAKIIIEKDVNAAGNVEIENAEIHGNVSGKNIILKKCIVHGDVIYKDTFINSQSRVLGEIKRI